MLGTRRLISNLVHDGHVTFVLPDGEVCNFGGASEQQLRVRILRWHRLKRNLLRPTLAFAEAWMAGDIEIEQGSLHDLVTLFYSNRGQLDQLPGVRFMRRFAHTFQRYQQRNTSRGASRNVRHHYDLPDEIYDLFLDSDRQYSCAYFSHDGATLEDAQAAKRQRVIAKLHVVPDQRVLDIGCGWGGLGLELATKHHARVKGLTLSHNQVDVARARAEKAGVADRVEFALQDYRKEAGQFERIVSVGMFEHVGTRYYPAFFRALARCLTNDGVALLHTIGRADGPGVIDPFIRRYIFPGGHIPALSELAPIIEQAGLLVTDVEVLRLHYAETLRHWRERFLARRDEALAITDERFCRMWELYLSGSEQAFRSGNMVVFQIQLAKHVNALPMTRSYMSNEA